MGCKHITLWIKHTNTLLTCVVHVNFLLVEHKRTYEIKLAGPLPWTSDWIG